MTKHVCKISRLNSKRLLRKLQKMLGGYFILPHHVVSAAMINVRLRLRGWTHTANLQGGGQNLALAAQGWSCGEPLSGGLVGECRGAGRTHGMLCSTSALLRPGTQSRPQVVQLLPFNSSFHTSARRNL